MKSNLPVPCHRCEPYGGTHTLVTGRGMERCDCARGKMLAKGDKVRAGARGLDPSEVKLPAPTPAARKAARQAAEALEDIPGCPRTDSSLTFLADELIAMARTAEQLQWIVKRARRLYRKWPGSRELRVLFCSRFMPRDGYELHDSEFFPEGIPSEIPQQQTDWKQIEKAHVISIDAGLQTDIEMATKSLSMPRLKQTKVRCGPEYLMTDDERKAQ